MGNLLIYSAADNFCIWPPPRCRRSRVRGMGSSLSDAAGPHYRLRLSCRRRRRHRARL